MTGPAPGDSPSGADSAGAEAETLHHRFHEVRLPEDFPVLWDRHQPWTDPLTNVTAHDVLELGVCLRGRGLFMIAGKFLPFRAGDCTVIRRHDWHVARSDEREPSDWIFVMLDPGRLVGDPGYDARFLCADTLGGPDFPNLLHPAEHPGLCSLLRHLAEELAAGAPGHRAVVRGLVAALMPMLYRLPGRSTPTVPAQDSAVARIAPALEAIAHSLGEELRIDDLADCCGVSTGHFRRLFQEAMGESPKQYLTRYRIHNAASLLEDRSRKVIDVALASGFQTLSSFNRQFRTVMGCAPREWRKRTVAV